MKLNKRKTIIASLILMTVGLFTTNIINHNVEKSQNSRSNVYILEDDTDEESLKNFSDNMKNTAEDSLNKAKKTTSTIAEEIKKDDSGNIDKLKEKVNDAKESVKSFFSSKGLSEQQTNGVTSNLNLEQSYADIYSQLQEVDVNNQTTKFIEVNGNQNNLTELDKNWESSHIIYSPLDDLNRTQTATAYLDKSNVGESKKRGGQIWKPTGFQSQPKVNGKQKNIYARGHLIAFTLSFNLNDEGNYEEGLIGSEDNPKNLFTQTTQSNSGIMQTYENLVRDTLKENKRVVYRVQPVFKGNDLMASGVWLQAYSPDDESLNFNVYLFNIQEGFNFNYETGRIIK